MGKARERKKSTGPILVVQSEGRCPDLEYASGFRTSGPAVFLGVRSGGVIVVPRLEVWRAEGSAKGRRVETPDTLGVPRRLRRNLAEWVVRLLRREGLRRVSVPASFPHGVAIRLQEDGVEVTVVKRPLFPGRAVKRTDEIRAIAAAQQAAVIAMRAAIALIGKSTIDVNGFLRTGGTRLTSEMVRAAISRTLIDHGCACGESIVACGPRGADPHELGQGPLRAHEPIVIDIFPQHLPSGYWGDLTRTVVRGVPSAIVRRMYKAVKSAQVAALDRVKAGAACAAVHEAAEEEFRRRGFKTQTRNGRAEGFIHSTGHGVGLSLHEAPSLGYNRARLKSGNVITIEPGLYYSEVGGMRIEDTVLVTASGWKYLAPCEKRREI